MGTLTRRRLGLLGAGLGLGAALGAAPGFARAGTSKPGLGLERLLDAVYRDGELLTTYRFNAALTWAGPDQLVFASPRWRTHPQIHVARLGGAVRVLADGSAPAVSSDGRWIAYLTLNGDIAVARLGQGGLEPVATLRRQPDGAGRARDFGRAFAWQAGRARLAYLSFRGVRQDGRSLKAVQLTEPEIRVYDPLTGDDTARYSVSLPKVEDPQDFAQTAIGGLAMTRDGTILFVEGEGLARTGMSAYLKALKDGKVRTIARLGAYALGKTPFPSPDGRWATVTASLDPPWLSYAATDYRAVVDLSSGEMRTLEGPYSVGEPAWAPDGQGAYYACKTGALADRVSLAATAAPEDRTGPPLDPLCDLQAIALSADGARMAWLSRDLEDRISLKVADWSAGRAASPPRTLWTDPLIDVGPYALGRTRAYRWTSYDGTTYEGLLTLPPGYAGGRLPLLVDIHGGSNGGVSLDGSMLNASPLERQVWAGMGYAHFSADYRAGFIVDRTLDAFRDVEGMSVYENNARDVLAGIQALVAQGTADPKRIAVLGHSMGSVTTTTLLSISDLPAVAVAKEGLEDWTTLGGVRDPTAFANDARTRMFTWRVDSLEAMRRAAVAGSPMFHPERIKTPLLVVKSSTDASRIADGERFVQAINAAGGEARLLAFPDDFHVVTREANSRRLAHEAVRWINGHLGVAPQGG